MLESPLNILVSYRRDDSSGHTGRLRDRLVAEFGADHVFMDLDSIPPGRDFVEAVRDAVQSCRVLLAVIGREWLTIAEGGQRRLDNPNDLVRAEILAALERGMPVIPVLVEGASMPKAKDLPQPLAALAQRNAIELSDSRWEYDTQRLIESLHGLIRARRRWRWPGRRLRWAGALTLLVLAGGGYLAYRYAVPEQNHSPRPIPEAPGKVGDTPGVQESARILGEMGLYSGPVEKPDMAALAEGLKEFQRSQGIPADGVLGPTTVFKLKEVGTRPPPSGQTDVEATKKRAKAIVQIFESGRPRNYVFLQALGGDLEYGYLFASLKQGSLHELIQAYCGDPAAKFSNDLRPYLERLAGKDPALAEDQRLLKLLTAAAGEDPVMIKTQDRMFDRTYWDRAAKEADAIGIRTPLGITAVFDTIIQSGMGPYQQLKEQTVKATDGTPVTGIDEKEWVRVYLEKRLQWLRNHRITAARATAYRAEELLKLVKEDNWDLRAPLTIRGTQIRA